MNVVVNKPAVKVTRLTPHIGAEITGVDLTRPIDEDTHGRILDALHEHIVICIRDQHFTPDQYVAAGSLFGDLMNQDQPELYGLEGYPKIRRIDSEQADYTGRKVTTTPEWHTDHTHYERPPKYTMLYPVHLPSHGGGTSFCNTRIGYERLPADLKARIDGMRTINVLAGSAARDLRTTNTQGVERGNQRRAEQPLVRRNPDHGLSKAVYFQPKKTENVIGMSPEASQDLLYDLMDRLVQDDTTYTHKWRMGDHVIWDNRSSLHKANSDFDHTQRRLFYRMCVEGEKAI